MAHANSGAVGHRAERRKVVRRTELESRSAVQKGSENQMFPTKVSQYVPIGDGAGELPITVVMASALVNS